ncbi:HNH endonuclease [Psychrobacter sp.]|uniref:HNH endonuclease n=1 Tax=Psychrobacter sp. TaxID=56811 RepID=UPI003C709EDA
MSLKTLRPRLSTIDTKAVNDTHQPKSRWGHGRGGRPWRRKRDEIFLRDKYTCQVCGRVGGELELDHIVNVARGGTDDDNNLQTLCKSPCHAAKTHAESKEI